MSGFIRQIQSSDGEPITPPSGVGGGGSGTGAKNYVLNPDGTDGVTDITVSGGVAVAQTTTIADLPEETKGNGILVTQTAGSAGNTAIWDTNAIDEGDKNTIGSPEMYYKTKAGYVDGDAKVFWKNTDSGETFDEFTINEGAGRISLANTSITLTEAENIKPHIEFNVSDSTGLVVSGVGTLAETRLVGATITDWQAYAAVTQGLGTTTQRLQWRQNGNDYEVIGDLDLGTVSGTEAQIGLPNNSVIELETTTDTAIVGQLRRDVNTAQIHNMLATNGDTYFNIGLGDGGNSPLNPANGNIFVSSERISFYARVPVSGVQGTVMLGTEAQGQNARMVASGTAGGSLSPGAVVLFTNEQKDTADGYNSGTGLYTVQFTGDYQVNALVTSSSSDMAIEIRLNGTSVYESAATTGANWGADVNTMLEDLVVGDTIGIYSNLGSSRTLSSLDADNRFTISKISDRTSSATGFPIPNGTLRLDTGNGHGSTNTAIRRFTNITEQSGDAFTYVDSATDGASITVNRKCVVSITYTDRSSASGFAMGISLNSTELTSSITDITNADRLSFLQKSSNLQGNASITRKFNQGDILRPHTSGSGFVSLGRENLFFEEVYNFGL